jgi:hypothetical protein
MARHYETPIPDWSPRPGDPFRNRATGLDQSGGCLGTAAADLEPLQRAPPPEQPEPPDPMSGLTWQE